MRFPKVCGECAWQCAEAPLVNSSCFVVHLQSRRAYNFRVKTLGYANLESDWAFTRATTHAARAFPPFTRRAVTLGSSSARLGCLTSRYTLGWPPPRGASLGIQK